MATTTTAVTAATGDAWTLAYTAGASVTIYIQNRSPGGDLLVRCGASTATDDAPGAAAEVLYPREGRSITLANGDKVHVRPTGPNDVALIVR